MDAPAPEPRQLPALLSPGVPVRPCHCRTHSRDSASGNPGAVPLLAATLAIVGITLVVLITPLGSLFGFGRLPAGFYPAILGIVALYIACAEGAKRLFYGRIR